MGTATRIKPGPCGALVGLLLLGAQAHADVSVRVGNCGANDECDVTVTGDAGELTLTVVGGGVVDWLRTDSTTYVTTTPATGTNNDGLQAASVAFAVPLTARVDFDGTRTGLEAAFGGVAVPLTFDGTSWSATIVPPAAPTTGATTEFGRVTVLWTHPTSYTDGNPLTLDEIVNTMVYWSQDPNADLLAVPAEQTVIVDAPANEVELDLPVGPTRIAATTMAMNGMRSDLSNEAFVDVKQTPTAPTDMTGTQLEPVAVALTVLSTRIEAAEWTCRDGAGAILSSHTRQDKAMEACANRALADPGVSYEIRPSGYRIVAQ